MRANAVRLAVPFFEQVSHMAGRYPRHNAAADHLVRQFTTAPLAERTAGLGGNGAGQRQNLADLFRREPGRTPRPGDSAAAVGHAQESQPTLPPGPGRINSRPT